MKQKVLLGISLCSLLALTGCVSEQTYVGSDKPVSDRSFDNIEAARTRISLGLNYLRRGDTSQAKYNLERARSFAPNSAEVHSALAYYYQSVGENKQAEEYFRNAISKDANYADAYNNYGAFLCQLNRYDEAEQLLLTAISRRGYIRVAESYENLALCQLQQNNFVKASTYLENSISHNATRITSLTLAAGLAYAMGDNTSAKERLDRIQRLGRVSARTVLLSYLIAEKSGDGQTQRSAEQLLLTLYTDTPETRLLLQNKTKDSEFERLRERYKDSLMANIVMPAPAATAQPVPAKPVANPKLKVVKRKTAEAEIEAEVDTFVRPRTEITHTASAIAGVLAANTAVSQPASINTELAAEVIVTAAQPEPEGAAEVIAAQPEPEGAAEVIAAQPEPAEAAEVIAAQPEPAVAAEVIAAQPESAEAAEVIAAQPESAEAAEVIAAQPDPEVETAALATEHVTDGGEAAAESDAAAEVSLPPAEPAFHLVQAAESLYAISVKHNIRLQRLMQWNQLTPESVIKTGQKIWLGPVSAQQLDAAKTDSVERQQTAATTTFHIVARGETMFAISYRYNIRLDKFMSWNGFTEQSTLQVGQQVYVADPVSIEQ
ncbi:type IV pilus biogenesis/stability protein PilW [Rheinheimera gaetbuli]